MKNPYNPSSIEQKWQDEWEKNGVYRQYDRAEKYYALDMFPYPSGAGLHVGHPKGYIATDVVARMKQLQGYGVLHPMGWDAFGLPAEQYALKNKVHPEISTRENVATYKKQLQMIGFTYDWDREINTTDPEYYKWTQWIFLQMFKAGLAYESHDPINWCPSCKTGLANEDLEQGKCERCGSVVEKRPLRQWVLRMTKYADRLLYDLDDKDLLWDESVKEQQRNWIGRSEGAEIVFPLAGTEADVKVFTTRLDTIFGATYIVIAPEHPLLEEFHSMIQNKEGVDRYRGDAQKKSDLERTELAKEKTGVLLEGIEVIHPFTGQRLPVYVADYVLGGYGTGAVMGVPAHDERDFVFAKRYDLPVVPVIEECVVTEGDRENAYKAGEKVEKRKNVAVCVYDPKTDAYLAISWKGFDMKGVVTGGMDEGESVEACARRELLEETGYKNLRFIGSPEVQKHTKFFHRGKKVNRHAEWSFALFELIDQEREEMSLEDQKQHDIVWIQREQAKSYFTVSEARWAVELFEHIESLPLTVSGILANSREFDGLESAEAREKMMQWLVKEGLGEKKVNYKMRDWTFSRQRYWGEPIPLIHCEKCGVVAVPENELPVKLPAVEFYEPTDTGESPLATIDEWVNVECPECGGKGRRETNTMPQWAGSCWYYLRYIDSKNDVELVSKEKEKKMMPVDLYVGGAEHATRHLLYARFWHKFLYDIGAVSGTEPFKRLINVGLILASDGRKMSKRWGNVINPTQMVEEFGADAFRTYEMFMGPFVQAIPWNTDGVVGTRRFLEKVWKISDRIGEGEGSVSLLSLLQKTIKKVGDDIEDFKFNTAVSSLMILANAFEKEKVLSRDLYEPFLILLAPFAPHLAEELWHDLGKKESIFLAKWPEYDGSKIKEEAVNIAVQVNGKLRAVLSFAPGVSEEEVKKQALLEAGVSKQIEGKEIRKVIFVPDKLINFVVG